MDAKVGEFSEIICGTPRFQNAPKTPPQHNLDFILLFRLTQEPLLCTLFVDLFAVVCGASLASFYNAVGSCLKYTSHSHV